jgi:sialate O-acetylesterase
LHVPDGIVPYQSDKVMVNKILKAVLLAALFIVHVDIRSYAQGASSWNNKQCAVVLTYDDAIDVDLDNVIPALDSLDFKGTFYLIGSSPTIQTRLSEWRSAAKNGHELGNHALFHPCDGSLPGRSFVTPEHDLSKYSVARAVEEVRINNTLLTAIDGKTRRTFAYPCGDEKIGGEYFYKALRNDFVGARGVAPGLQTAKQVNLDNINSYAINGQSAEYLIDLVKQAQRTHTVLVFLFHGVGGGHSLNVSLDAHSKLLHYLKANEKSVWVASMVDVAQQIASAQKP